MKELEEVTKAPTSVSAEREVQKKLTKVSEVKPYRGHTLFKVDKKTLEIQPAKIEDTVSVSKDKAGMNVIRKRVLVEEGFAYFSALNENNVKRKIKRLVDPTIAEELWAKLEK